jgi:hypothetical protein
MVTFYAPPMQQHEGGGRGASPSVRLPPAPYTNTAREGGLGFCVFCVFTGTRHTLSCNPPLATKEEGGVHSTLVRSLMIRRCE